MRPAALMSFLSRITSAEEFAQEITDEVSACFQAMKEGAAGHIVVTNAPETIVTRRHFVVLLEAITAGRISIEAGNYIADALIMSDEFGLADDDVLIEGVHALAQDFPLPTRQEVQELLDRIA